MREVDQGPEERFVEVQGVRLRYERAGSGPPLLLLHGLVGSAQNWRRNLQSFAEHSTVYAIDLPNMGGSERVPGLDASLEATADRLPALLDALGLSTVDVAAHSHGGAVAMMFAVRHPSRSGRLILFAPANPFCNLGEGLIRFYQTRLGLCFARTIPWLPRQWTAIALGRMYGDRSRVPEDALSGYTEGLKIPGTMDHVLRIVACWRSDMSQLRTALRRMLDVPTLLIWGDRDSAVGLRSAEQLQRYLSRAELLTISGVGHIPFEEAPDAVNFAVARWLRHARRSNEDTVAQSSARLLHA